MADDNTTVEDSVREPDNQHTEAPKSDVPPEVKAALRKANKEAEALRLKLKEYEDRDKTEAQRLAERAEEAERAAEGAKREALRYRIAAKYQVSDEDAELFLTGSDEETLVRQAERLAKRTADDITSNGAYVPSEGRTPSNSALNSDQLEQALRASLGI